MTFLSRTVVDFSFFRFTFAGGAPEALGAPCPTPTGSIGPDDNISIDPDDNISIDPLENIQKVSRLRRDKFN